MVVKEVLWENVREEIVHINPTLTQLIDNVSPGKTLPFVEIHYRYGDLIIDKGKIMPPSELTADIEKSQAFKKLCRDMEAAVWVCILPIGHESLWWQN
jgi:uncharacterized protein (DUF2062 family)